MPKKEKVKVIIDTNLFISFLIGKRLKGLKSLLINSSIELIFSEQNITELKNVTSRPKLQKYFNKKDVDELIEFIFGIGYIFETVEEPDICRDKKDNFLLELAEISNATYLLTGDKDLLEIKNYQKTKIISVEKFEKLMKL